MTLLGILIAWPRAMPTPPERSYSARVVSCFRACFGCRTPLCGRQAHGLRMPPLPEAVICSRARRRRVMIAVVFPERRASQFDLRPALFLELLHSMFLVVGDSLCKRHRTRHANMSEGDKECLFFVQRNEVAHDTAFITSIRGPRKIAVAFSRRHLWGRKGRGTNEICEKWAVRGGFVDKSETVPYV